MDDETLDLRIHACMQIKEHLRKALRVAQDNMIVVINERRKGDIELAICARSIRTHLDLVYEALAKMPDFADLKSTNSKDRLLNEVQELRECLDKAKEALEEARKKL